MKNILLIASEAVPFIKTGGLADVVGALPKYIDKENYDIRVVIPYYTCIKEELRRKATYITHFYMDLGFNNLYVGIFEAKIDGVHFYFIDNERYFNVTKPYGDIAYDIEKFIYFSKASLSFLEDVGFKPDIIHCNDWQTGFVPVYLKTLFNNNPFYEKIKTVMTIHNLKFQGRWRIEEVAKMSGLSYEHFTHEKLEFYGDANILKGGIVFADKVNTVSDTYAKEIKTSLFGEGLDGLLFTKGNNLLGIVNGIDYEEYNPKTDTNIYVNYDVTDFRKKRAKNKTKLQKELGLTEDSKKFMIGMCTRLTDQKGLDLIAQIFESLICEDIQFVILGTGDERYENMFRYYEWKYKGRVSSSIMYSDERAHKIYSACDAFLMPSLFEPCGLGQLIALRYGAVPIVRETGGLADTVEPFNEYTDEGVGYSFKNYDAKEMLHIIKYALQTYTSKKRAYNKIVERGMKKDFSWETSVKLYQALYDDLIKE